MYSSPSFNADNPATPTVISNDPAPQLAKKKVLCIEDEPELIALITLMLRRNGFDVDSSSSLKSAKKRLVSSIPDVVLLDLHLPDGTGWDIISWMQQHPGLDDVPVILVTGDGDVEERCAPEDEEKSGVASVLIKPFTLRALRQAIQTALVGRQSLPQVTV